MRNPPPTPPFTTRNKRRLLAINQSIAHWDRLLSAARDDDSDRACAEGWNSSECALCAFPAAKGSDETTFEVDCEGCPLLDIGRPCPSSSFHDQPPSTYSLAARGLRRWTENDGVAPIGEIKEMLKLLRETRRRYAAQWEVSNDN